MNVGRKMNELMDRSLNTANKDRWGGEVEHEKQMPQLTPQRCLRLSAIILMNRQEDSDTCLYDMWKIHIHDAALHLFLCIIRQVAAAGGGEKNVCVYTRVSILYVINGSNQLSPVLYHYSTTNDNTVAFLLLLQSVMRSSSPASFTGSA